MQDCFLFSIKGDGGRGQLKTPYTMTGEGTGGKTCQSAARSQEELCRTWKTSGRTKEGLSSMSFLCLKKKNIKVGGQWKAEMVKMTENFDQRLKVEQGLWHLGILVLLWSF